MVRTRNRPIVKGSISSKNGCMIGTGLMVSSVFAYTAFAPYTWSVATMIWGGYLMAYLPAKQKTIHNTPLGAVVGALPPLLGSMA